MVAWRTSSMLLMFLGLMVFTLVSIAAVFLDRQELDVSALSASALEVFSFDESTPTPDLQVQGLVSRQPQLPDFPPVRYVRTNSAFTTGVKAITSTGPLAGRDGP